MNSVGITLNFWDFLRILRNYYELMRSHRNSQSFPRRYHAFLGIQRNYQEFVGITRNLKLPKILLHSQEFIRIRRTVACRRRRSTGSEAERSESKLRAYHFSPTYDFLSAARMRNALFYEVPAKGAAPPPRKGLRGTTTDCYGLLGLLISFEILVEPWKIVAKFLVSSYSIPSSS